MASCWIVAEAGVNWDGDRGKIIALIKAAKQSGASHIKFQAFSADALIARRKIGDQKTIDLLRRNELTDADLDTIRSEAGRLGIPHFYSVFDPSQVERVLSRGACALKIGHAEESWSELRNACYARFTNDCLVWVSHALGIGDRYGNVACRAEYPATSKPLLSNIDDEGGYEGFSSHYTDYRIPAAAALRGAEYIEAHLKLSDADPEAAWSLDVEDFTKMVKLIREYETWL